MRTHRKQPPQAPKHTYEAHSTYTAGLGVPDRRQYRRTPPGAPTAADLVWPGDTVATTYNTGGVVIEVKEYFYAAPTGETLSHFTIVYVPADRATKYRDTDHHWINECVAVDGRILMLFEANADEVFVVDRAQSVEPRRSRTILITEGTPMRTS
ncbi:hypothetical protein ABGN05_24125 [Aquibium sp. LZ166]|uniref:Uncharacterized protein n=1 Tax=Aquibium pacificus TaxID=3153579 RepID=A0ABV3SS58_9HYPH